VEVRYEFMSKSAGSLKEIGTASQKTETTPTLPFTTRSLLEMCWGMTLNFSHEAQQQALGKVFTDEFMRIFAKKEENAVNPEFLQELTMALSATVRSIGFIRACHVQYCDFNSDRLTRQRQSLEKMADYSSFSGSGLFAKLGSFVGFGSVAQFITSMNWPQFYVLPFALGGVIGAYLVTALVNWRVQSTYKTWADKLTQLQSEYWRKEFKPDVTDQLYDLYIAIKKLAERYCRGACKSDELLKADEKYVKEVINQDILPPDDLQWPPYTVTLATKTAASTTLKAESVEEDQKEQKGKVKKN
jgi:hypothetical protein